jgi:hypothetical protein
MTQYRKAGMRTFYKVADDGTVTKILNKELLSQVTVCKNYLVKADALDPQDTKEISEAEFNEQYEIAKQRLLNQSVI